MIKKEQQPIYVSPKVKTIEILAHTVLCQSGNKSMYVRELDENDFESL